MNGLCGSVFVFLEFANTLCVTDMPHLETVHCVIKLVQFCQHLAFADAEGSLVLYCVYMWMKGIKYLLYRAERPDASLLQRLLGNGESGSAAIHYFVSGMKFGYGIYYVFNKIFFLFTWL